MQQLVDGRFGPALAEQGQCQIEARLREQAEQQRALDMAHQLAAAQIQPQFLFISAGFDAHVLDDMSSLCLTEADYGWLTERLMAVAGKHCGGRILSMLEGGYEPGALARSVVAHLKAFLG